MVDYGEGLRNAARNAFCTTGNAINATGLIQAGLDRLGIIGTALEYSSPGILAHLYRNYCNAPIPPGTLPDRPFSGGQCNNRRYIVPIFRKVTDTDGGAFNIQGKDYVVWGRINAIKFDVKEELGNQVELTIDGSQDDDVFELIHAGEFILDPEGSGQLVPKYQYELLPVVCRPQDGLPDTCGDPPPPPPQIPPGPQDRPDTIVYIDNDGNTINVPVTFNFGIPRIDVNGVFNMPITVRFDADPTINFGGDINFNTGDFSINLGPGRPPTGTGGGDPDNVTRPDTPPPALPPGEDVPPPDPDEDEPGKPPRVIRGALVTVLSADSAPTIIFQGQNPDIYAPNLGYISFFCRVNDAGGWTADIPIKNRRQLVPCPWQYGAFDVKGTPRGGSLFNVEPVYDLDEEREIPS
jgi:hypothetical protein